MKWIRKEALICFGMVLGLFPNLKSQNQTLELSLKDACRMGLENNTMLHNASLENEKAGIHLSEVRSQLYPQIEAYSNLNYYYSIPRMVIPGEIFGQSGMLAVQIGTRYDWSSGFKATQVLYNQSCFTSVRLAEQMKELSRLSEQQKKEQLVYQIHQVYYLCLNTHYQLSQYLLSLKNYEQMLTISTIQHQTGMIRQIDCSRIQVTKNNVQTTVDNLHVLLQQDEHLLKYLIGLPEHQNVALSDSLMSSSPSLLPPDVDKQTEIQSIDQQLKMNFLTRKQIRQSFLPVLSGVGHFYFEGQQDQFNFFQGKDKFYKVGYLGLNLSIPVFNGFEKRYKSKVYDIERLQLQNNKKNATDLFNKAFSDALIQYHNSMVTLLRQKENTKLAEKTYLSSMQWYQEQSLSLSDLLLSESNLIESRLSEYNALFQLKNTELEIKKAQGDLLNF